MRQAFKSVVRLLLGEYAFYEVWRVDRVVESSVGQHDVRRIQAAELQVFGTDEALTSAAWYFGPECDAFGCFEGDRLVGVAFYWRGARYAARDSWNIEARAAKLVHIVTAPSFRGRGVAGTLIEKSASLMIRSGSCPLYARIWHSHKASLAAFERAGWTRLGWLVQINPLRRLKPWKLALRGR